MSLSIETMSQPVSEELPSGENLEYDPQFREMETLSQPRQEGMVEGEGRDSGEPDWKGVEKLAISLSENTRDLRVQVYATLASIHTRGIPGFRDNLAIIKLYLEDFWGTVHPQLDPEDDNDPMLRLSTLQMLNDYSMVGRALQNTKLVELKGLGQFGVRQVDLAEGKESPAEDEEVTDTNAIREAFIRADQDYIATLRVALAEAVELLDGIAATWSEKATNSEALDFDVAKNSLNRISAVLKDYLPSDVAAEQDGEVGDMATGGGGAISGAVRSRADVIRTLDKVCEYYTANEPSSPIPLLLRRAQRLVEKSFIEILEDMVPDGVAQAKIVSGTSTDDT